MGSRHEKPGLPDEGKKIEMEAMSAQDWHEQDLEAVRKSFSEFISLVNDDGSLSDRWYEERAKWVEREKAGPELLKALEQGAEGLKNYAHGRIRRINTERKRAVGELLGQETPTNLANGTDPMIRLAATELAEVAKKVEQVEEATERRIDKLEAEIDAVEM